MLRNSSEHLRARVKNTIKAAEEEIWKKGLLHKTGHLETKPDFLTLEIQLESKDKWHTRPEGIVLLTVVAGLLLQIINLLLGLL